MGDDVYISFGIMVLFGACAAGSDSPWWARSLAAAYVVAAAFCIGRHTGASRIGRHGSGPNLATPSAKD